MQTLDESYIMLTVRNGFLVCPTCRRNRHLLKVPPDTEAVNLLIYCPDCKTEHGINIREGPRFESRSR